MSFTPVDDSVWLYTNWTKEAYLTFQTTNEPHNNFQRNINWCFSGFGCWPYTNWTKEASSKFSNNKWGALVIHHSFFHRNFYWCSSGFSYKENSFQAKPPNPPRLSVGRTWTETMRIFSFSKKTKRGPLVIHHTFFSRNIIWYLNGCSSVENSFLESKNSNNRWFF